MDNQTWLNQVIEPIIEPGRPIVDPHHHLLEYADNRYLADELLQDLTTGHNIVSTVFVECGAAYRSQGPEAMRPLGEVEFVERIAQASETSTAIRVAEGIVSFADLTLGSDVEGVLEAQRKISPNRLRGIRHAVDWHPDPGIRNSHSGAPEHVLCDPRFREGFAVLQRLDLSFDAWLYHPQLPELVDLARAFPDTTIILDHFGGPLGIGPYENRADEVFATWAEAITPLADCPNVVCKLGGINMKVNGFGWHTRPQPPSSDELVDATARYYLHTIKLFGAQRCMFESNFPVDKESCSYPVLWNAFKKMTAHMGDTERNDLFHDTASRVYRLSQ